MIVNSGLNLIRDLLANTATPPSHMAVGTGTAAVVAGDTTLGTEAERNALSTKAKSGNGIMEYVMTLDATEGNGSSLSEVGIFNAAAAGSMLLRKTHTPYAKTASFAVKYVVRHTNTNV